MKLRSYLLAAALLAIFTVTSRAQEMVVPNKPFTVLNSEPGYVTTNELTFGFGLRYNDLPFEGSFVGVTTTHSYQVNKNFLAGGGTGVLVYNGGTLMPLYLDFRYNVAIKKVTPFVYADGGMLFGLLYNEIQSPLDGPAPETDVNKGTRIYINGGTGVSYAFDRKLAITTSAGLWIQMLHGRESFFNFRVGLIYKPF